mmetsp:Transcript_12820/g.20734  ORF Transcript_12820/g.20734 Transcript_12820/m.20734 type:complete len:255 (+) Transcript_12820:1610-2374(+)
MCNKTFVQLFFSKDTNNIPNKIASTMRKQHADRIRVPIHWICRNLRVLLMINPHYVQTPNACEHRMNQSHNSRRKLFPPFHPPDLFRSVILCQDFDDGPKRNKPRCSLQLHLRNRLPKRLLDKLHAVLPRWPNKNQRANQCQIARKRVTIPFKQTRYQGGPYVCAEASVEMELVAKSEINAKSRGNQSRDPTTFRAKEAADRKSVHKPASRWNWEPRVLDNLKSEKRVQTQCTRTALYWSSLHTCPVLVTTPEL